MGAMHGSVTVRRYVVRGEKSTDINKIVRGAKAHVLTPIDPRTDAEKVCGWSSILDPYGLELVPRGPVVVAGRNAIPAGLTPTPEMVLGFPGLPGRMDEAELDVEEVADA